VQVGYRIDELNLPPIDEIKDSVSVKIYKNCNTQVSHRIERVSSGMHVDGYVLPIADTQYIPNILGGLAKRVAYVPPKPDADILLRFRRFVNNWIRSNLQPLLQEEYLSFEKWLDESNYTNARKRQLSESRYNFEERGSKLGRNDFIVKTFVKHETYPEFKYPRLINARNDTYKTLVGPFFKSIEKVLYKRKEFIKHVPVADRAKYIKEMLYKPGMKYSITDHSQYEAHFLKQMMETCEFQLYNYMASKLNEKEIIMKLINRLKGLNRCKFRNGYYKVLATRMSGEMNTSLGNGFTNLMIMYFILDENGNVDVVGVVEGDDGLFRFEGEPPTEEMFRKLGFTIKLVIVDNLNEASFCGLIFDLNDMELLTDPKKVLLNFGWIHSQYMNASDKTLLALLRMKSMSSLYQFPSCPIVTNLAMLGLRVTSSVNPKVPANLNNYSKRLNERIIRNFSGIIRPIKFGSRLLVEKFFF